MLDEKTKEILTERIASRIDEINTELIKKIAQDLMKLRNLKPSEARKLAQILKYGGNYNKIIKMLQDVTKLNLKEIEEILYEVAKNNVEFAQDFYKYRTGKKMPFEKNKALLRQIDAISKITKETYSNLSKSSAIGYSISDAYGNIKFKNISSAYNDLVDKAVISVSQGKSTFDKEMRSIINQLGTSGIKTIDYESGRTKRLDSAVRMNMQEALTKVHNETQMIIGKQYGSDGIEISVHENPAIDHEEVQGRQFTNEEYEKLQNGEDAKDYKGNTYNLHHNHNEHYRQIGTLNCYHTIFSVILGISQPLYTDKQLEDIRKTNDKGFEFEGKHYTNYQGTQLQRKIEAEIRKQKDILIGAKEINDNQLAVKSQLKITMLESKYKQLNKISGLKDRKERLRVSGYRKIGKKTTPRHIEISKDEQLYNSMQNIDKEELRNMYIRDLEDKKIVVHNSAYQNIPEDLMLSNLKQLDALSSKYTLSCIFEDKKNLLLTSENHSKAIGWCSGYGSEISLCPKYFKDEKYLIDVEKRCGDINWHVKVGDDKLNIYTITHEYGHACEADYINAYVRRFNKVLTQRIRKEIDKEIYDEVIRDVSKSTGLSKTEIKDKYFSKYAKSKRNFEWFAEAFVQLELGEQNELTDALKKWLGAWFK